MDDFPQQVDSLEDTLRLALIPGVGPRTRLSLLQRFGSAQNIFKAAPSQLREVHGVGPKLTQAIVRGREELDVDTIVAHCRDTGTEILTENDEAYPRLLREIHDPPGVLFVRGKLLAEDAVAMAVVGSRHATRYGLEQAKRLGSGLARSGLTVVSGLARGVDAAAHRGAIEAGGRTMAVLASGLSRVYPPEHGELAEQVVQHGALLSEAPPFSPPNSGAFPQRNRLITGLSLGVVVVEAALRSGALISAEHAMEQGRDVFAVPGRVDSRMSRGCHRLLREGAKLVEQVEDVLDELGPLVAAVPSSEGRMLHSAAELQLNEQECAVLDAVGKEPTGIDDIVFASGLPVHRVLATISVLEMRRLVRRISGCLVARI